MQTALMMTHLYGRQAVGRKLKKGVKTQNMHAGKIIKTWWSWKMTFCYVFYVSFFFLVIVVFSQ